MKVILDHSLPIKLRNLFHGASCTAGLRIWWAASKKGALSQRRGLFGILLENFQQRSTTVCIFANIWLLFWFVLGLFFHREIDKSQSRFSG